MTTLNQPLDGTRFDVPHAWPMTAHQMAWGFVALGAAVRLVRYLLCMPLWVDECLLSENFLDRGYAELLRPLINDQVAPVGFLWVELTAVRLFGFSEWSLRLFPVCCGIASLFLFRRLAARILSGTALVLAVACLAVAKAPIGLSVDVKPYACDLLVAIGLLALAVEWLCKPERARWLWGLALAAPAAVFLSLPAIFVVGGISLALAAPVWKARNGGVWRAWLVLNVLAAAAFLLLMHLNVSDQYRDKHAFMVRYWTKHDAFPPLSNPLQFLSWFVQVHAGDNLCAYPYAAENGGGALGLACCAVAAVILYRRGWRVVLTMLLCPLALVFVAAALRRYPYGGHVRLMQFIAPAICLLTGLGAATLLSRIADETRRRRALAGLCLILAAFGIGLMLRDTVQPWEHFDDRTYRAFAQRLWRDDADGIVVCSKTDFGQEFCDLRGYTVPYAYYRCYQRLYSPAHRQGANAAAGRLALARRPVRLIVFEPPHLTLDQARVDGWLETFAREFEIAGPRLSSVPQSKLPKDEVPWDKFGTFSEYRLVPRPGVTTPVHYAGLDRTKR